METTYGALSLLPVATILIIAISTKRTLFAMFCGTIVAALILGGGIGGLYETAVNHLYAGMTNGTAQWLWLVIAMFGILIVMFERSGAVKDFALWARKFIKTERQALFGTFIMGIIVFVDDYLNNLTVSTTMKGVTDDLRIPRTKLAYIVNTVAAPVCLMIPFSSWAVYYSGLLEGEGLLVNGSGMGAYISALPYAFYPIAALIIAILVIVGVIPSIGLIKKDTIRANETGNVFPDGIIPESNKGLDGKDEEEHKPQPFTFLVPIAVMVAVTLIMGSDVLIGTIAGVITITILSLVMRKMTFFNFLTSCYDGILSMGFVIILTALAFTVQGMNLELQLTEYVIEITLPIMEGAFLPAVAFIVCALYAYATGCFWDLAIIVVPILIPLANAMGVDPILTAAAIFSGTAFGSNTCLYGDGVIMCSQGAEIKPVHLMMATLPYALMAAGIAIIGYLICGFVM